MKHELLMFLSVGYTRDYLRAMKEGDHDLYLGSWHDIGQRFKHDKEVAPLIQPKDFRFFLDSGAYSAWTRGTPIDLDEYCAFIRANIESIDVYASLDAIPGQIGKVATEAEREAAAEQSWANYQYMVREGLDPLPVFHYGEPMRFLDRILDHKIPYIGIGGLVGVPGALRQPWLDRVFAKLVDDTGHPTVKVHGFGMTSVPLIFRYPWYSVDSTSWVRATAAGSILVPQQVRGQFVFDRVPTTLAVSSKNPGQTKHGKTGQTLSASSRRVVDEWLEVCGKTFEEVAADYYHRAVCNVVFFRKVGEAKTDAVFKPTGIARQTIWD